MGKLLGKEKGSPLISAFTQAAGFFTPENLFEAAKIGDVVAIKRILETGHVDVDCSGFVGTPLMMAADEGRYSAVVALLDAGADVNAVITNSSSIPEGITAIMYAAMSQYPDVRILRECILAGGDINHQDDRGYTALHAITMGWEKSVDSSDLDCASDFVDACSRGHVALIPNYAGKVDIARTLLAHGADLELKDKRGRTPRHMLEDVIRFEKNDMSKREPVSVLKKVIEQINVYDTSSEFDPAACDDYLKHHPVAEPQISSWA